MMINRIEHLPRFVGVNIEFYTVDIKSIKFICIIGGHNKILKDVDEEGIVDTDVQNVENSATMRI